jgi:predicted LPLAT superfamily acyltransferase
MVWASLTLGRGPSRVLLRIISAYFLAFGGEAGRASRADLRRCLGREPTLGERYRHVFTFATTLHDRVYFLKGRFDLFDIEVHGRESLGSGGALLMGAHLGSFEALRACGREFGRRPVAMAMYADNAQQVNAVLSAIAPEAAADIVALGHVHSMLALHERLEAGALVGLLADRTLGAEPGITVPFLGEPAHFPTGPMRMAAALRQPVLFMTALHLGGNRYAIHLEPLADFTDMEGVARPERDRRVRQATADFARRLESHTRRAPYNWFNFFDFWGRR